MHMKYLILIFTHLKLWVATATHNFKCVKITRIFLIWDVIDIGKSWCLAARFFPNNWSYSANKMDWKRL